MLEFLARASIRARLKDPALEEWERSLAILPIMSVFTPITCIRTELPRLFGFLRAGNYRGSDPFLLLGWGEFFTVLEVAGRSWFGYRSR